MEDFSAPSFSLGLDLDFADQPTEGEEEKEQEPHPRSTNRVPFPQSLFPQESQEETDHQTLDPDLDLQDDDPPPALKRLRRGPPPPRPLLPAARPLPTGREGEDGSELFSNLDDEIEDFSSQEEDRRPGICPSIQSHGSCSSSKFSLRCRGVLSSQSASKLKTPRVSPASNASTSTNFEASSNRNLFPKLTISPLRRIHLLDSDSDDPSPNKGKGKDGKQASASQKVKQHTPSQSSIRNEQKTFQSNKPQAESFWKDFSPKKNVSLSTPALDEFCEDYFRSSKGQKVSESREEDMTFSSSRIFDPDDFVDDFEGHQQKSITKEREHNWNLPNPQPPSYQYFFHDDPRIRTLVRQRLPYFVPLGAENHSSTQQFGAEHLDYMTQFGSRDCPSQVGVNHKKGSQGNSRTRRRKPSSINTEETSHSAGRWMNPRNNATAPKDAGKRRVSANGSQSGHWFTGQDGRKIYITKNGQELAGQMAYRQYRKESGAGFRKGRKKAAVKRKRKG